MAARARPARLRVGTTTRMRFMTGLSTTTLKAPTLRLKRSHRTFRAARVGRRARPSPASGGEKKRKVRSLELLPAVSRVLAGRRDVLFLSGLAVLAVAGQLVLNQAAVTLGRMAGFSWTVLTSGFDFVGIWYADTAFVHGKAFAWYGTGISNAWPPPHEVLFAPLGWLSYDGAHFVTTILTAALMVFTVVLWSREPLPGQAASTRGSLAWPIMLSAPVFAV